MFVQLACDSPSMPGADEDHGRTGSRIEFGGALFPGRRTLGRRARLARPAGRTRAGARLGDRTAPRPAGIAGARAGRARRRSRRGRGLSRSDHQAADARSAHADRHGSGRQPHRRCDHARGEGRHLRRLRRRWRDRCGAAVPLPAALRARSDRAHPGPHLRRLRAERGRDPRLCGAGRHAAGHGRLRHHQPRAVGGGRQARRQYRRHRPSPGRRGTSRCGGHRQSQPRRRSLRSRASGGGRAGVPDARCD